MAIRLIDGSEFLHLPKTGGSWAATMLQQSNLIDSHVGWIHSDYDMTLFGDEIGGGKKHVRYASKLAIGRLRQLIDNHTPHLRSTDRFRFCFVRHPLTWYESWWKWMTSREWNTLGRENSASHWHPNSILNGLGDECFNTFVSNVISKRPGYVSELYFSFTKPGISFIGKTENLVDDFLYVMDVLGLPFDENKIKNSKKINISEVPDQSIVWDRDLKKTVMLLELPALIHFGYLTQEEQKEFGFNIDILPNPAMFKK